MKTKRQWIGMVIVLAVGLLGTTRARATLVVNPVAGAASYSTYETTGGYAMKVESGPSTQWRMRPSSTLQTITMSGADLTLESSMDMMWLDLPQSLPAVHQRYWDYEIVVGGVTYSPSAGNFGMNWNWAQFPVSSNQFTRWVQTFTLPHLAFDNVGLTNVNIDAWKLYENRTIQLYDGGVTFDSSAVLLDNISLRVLPGGANINVNGDFVSSIAGWSPDTGSPTLSLYGPLPNPEPSTALLLLTGAGLIASRRKQRL